MAYCIPSMGSRPNFKRIRDARLCNNAEMSTHTTSTVCTTEGYARDITCDDRYIKDDDCLESIITMSSFSEELLEQMDRNISIRRISIHLSAIQMINYTQLGFQIDTFLTPRLWWYVVMEPSDMEPISPNGTALIMFDRVHHQLEISLRHLANIQYPLAHQCVASVLLLGRHDMGHPGWWSVMAR